MRKSRRKQIGIIIGLSVMVLGCLLAETGKRKMDVEQIIKICEFYNISADYLLGFTNDAKPLPKK